MQKQKESHRSFQDYHCGAWVVASKSFSLQPSDATNNSVATIKDDAKGNDECDTSASVMKIMIIIT